jgi:GR25 family glycosyltransferase involved in LPS biosynthesis
MKSKPEILVLFFLLGFFIIFILIRSHYFYRSSQDTFTTFLHQNQSHAMETEPFESKLTEIDYYVITMKNPERIENINQQMNILKKQGTPVHIELVDAVKGIDLNLNELIKQETLSPNYQSGYGEAEKQKKKEIGCFMSHLKIHELIQQKQTTHSPILSSKKYSVIFEDDFKIVSDHFVKEIEDSLTILEKTRPDFDLLYLGTNYENHGNIIEHHTYEIDKKNVLFGTHAILVNNAKIDKFIKNLKPIKQPIDVQYMELCKSDALNAYILFPKLVIQQFDKIPSTITSENFV